MKPIYWVIIILSATIIPLGLVLLITRVILDPPKSFWWFGGTLIFYFIIGIVAGVIFLIIKLKKKVPEKLSIDPDDAEERAKMLLVYDNDNPDNFIREGRVIKRVGQSGSDRTPILWLWGKGSETQSKIDILVNLNNPKKEILLLFNKKEEFILESIRTLAENPESQETEERILGMDELGRPTTTVRTKRVTMMEKKEQDEKKEAEELNAY